MKYTKPEAIRVLAGDLDNPRITRSSLRRCMKACKSLGLSPDDTKQVLQSWDYIDPKTGELYERFKEKP